MALCFVLMPFGKKKDTDGREIDFDVIYKELIDPAIREARLEPLRADEEMVGGIIHKAMFERLILCPFAVADLTLANANVFYELGIRHAARPRSTVSIYADGSRLPFDVSPFRALPYGLDENKRLANVDAARKLISSALVAAQHAIHDSPVFQLLDYLPWKDHVFDVEHQKTDVFRERNAYCEKRKEQLRIARGKGLAEVAKVEQELRSDAAGLNNEEVGVLIDQLLSYRDVKGWAEMSKLCEDLPEHVKRTAMVQEQWALALNREAGDLVKAGNREEARLKRDKAVNLCEQLIKTRGPSSETYGILGRIRKDQWDEAKQAKNFAAAEAFLGRAIAAYGAGFEADQRDAYPGINYVTLMEINNTPGREKVVPVVRYAVDRKMAREADYWDHATCLELAVLGRNEPDANERLGEALTSAAYDWQKETTANNLRLIAEARRVRGENVDWINNLVAALLAK